MSENLSPLAKLAQHLGTLPERIENMADADRAIAGAFAFVAVISTLDDDALRIRDGEAYRSEDAYEVVQTRLREAGQRWDELERELDGIRDGLDGLAARLSPVHSDAAHLEFKLRRLYGRVRTSFDRLDGEDWKGNYRRLSRLWGHIADRAWKWAAFIEDTDNVIRGRTGRGPARASAGAARGEVPADPEHLPRRLCGTALTRAIIRKALTNRDGTTFKPGGER